MIAVITGDIINSQHAETEVWITKLKNLLENWGSAPHTWEIYREMSFSSNVILMTFSGISSHKITY
jgi:hypothetical protein